MVHISMRKEGGVIQPNIFVDRGGMDSPDHFDLYTLRFSQHHTTFDITSRSRDGFEEILDLIIHAAREKGLLDDE